MTLSKIKVELKTKKSKATFNEGEQFINKLYTDGSWNPKTKAGGWCVAFQHKPLKSGYDTQTTSIRMEITAMIKALKLARPYTIILTDSMFTINSLNIYCPAWARGNWHKDMANKELMIELWQAWLNRAEGVGAMWVKGHNGLAGNEVADAEAVRQRKIIEGTYKRYVKAKSKQPKRRPKPKRRHEIKTTKRYKRTNFDNDLLKARAELELANNRRFGKGNW